MITARDARKKSLEAQMSLVETYIQDALDLGFKSICISNELEEAMYKEIIEELLKNGFDVIFKKYTDCITEIVSWENGKESNGSQITLDCRLSDSQDTSTTYILYPDDNNDFNENDY